MNSLFSKYNSSKLKLKNRVVMSPMSRYSSDENGFPSKELIEYYIKRVKCGVSLIIIEAASIDSSSSRSYINGLGFYTSEHAKFWEPIIKIIHSYGALVFIQLYHAGRLTTSKVCGTTPIAPSAIPPMKQRSHMMEVMNNKAYHFQSKEEFITPHEMKIEDIVDVQNKFAKSSELAERAGFDGVEIHGAHGNLIHQFTSKLTNHRSDIYGKNQYLFLKETVSKCRSAISNHTILSLRISQHMVDSSFIRFSKGVMDFEDIVRQNDSMVDIFNCSEIVAGAPMFGHNKSLSAEVRSFSSKTIITSGQIDSIDKANDLLNSSSTDLIGFGRLLISNPNLVELLTNNHEDLIVPYDYKIHSNRIE
jgi:2,4-dienoyl-CoA reductase-like NADH-dependent reductase (Old Yellow Enzyme family)